MPVVQYCSYCSYCTTKFYSFSLDTGSYCIVMVMKRRGTDIAGQTLNRAMCAQNEKDFAKMRCRLTGTCLTLSYLQCCDFLKFSLKLRIVPTLFATLGSIWTKVGVPRNLHKECSHPYG